MRTIQRRTKTLNGGVPIKMGNGLIYYSTRCGHFTPQQSQFTFFQFGPILPYCLILPLWTQQRCLLLPSKKLARKNDTVFGTCSHFSHVWMFNTEMCGQKTFNILKYMWLQQKWPFWKPFFLVFRLYLYLGTGIVMSKLSWKNDSG